MGEAFASACAKLHDSNLSKLLGEIIAERIIEAARRRERDPERLCKTAARTELFLRLALGAVIGARFVLGFSAEAKRSPALPPFFGCPSTANPCWALKSRIANAKPSVEKHKRAQQHHPDKGKHQKH